MKKLLITGLIAMGAMFFAPAKAHAQTIATFDVPFSINSATHQPVAGSSGSFHTVVTYLGGSTYQVTVTGNNDGNPSTEPANVPNPVGSPIPKSGVGLLSFNFFDGNGVLIQNTAIAGSTNAYSGPAGGNLGGPSNVPFGNTGGAFSISPALADTLVFSAQGNKDLYVAPHGGNTFTGTFTLASPISNLNTIQASYQDSGQQYNLQVQLVPEPATAAMALPGLLTMAPLGLLALRRRRKATSDVETEEAEA